MLTPRKTVNHESTRTDTRRARRGSLIFVALALCAWGVLVVRAYQVFGPDSSYVQPFNSDSALPVLMANDEKLDAFRTYIYGQDQIGAWPFIAAQLVRRATGYTWTPHSIYLVQVVWLCLSILVVAALCRACALLTGALLAAVLCLHPTVSHYLFVLNQRYAWQVTPLVCAWLCLRQLCARLSDAPTAGRARVWLWSVAAFCFALLAVWTSPLSTPVLCALFALEVLRARLSAADAQGQQRPAHVLKNFLPVVAAIVTEQLLKANYHRFALKHYGTNFKTPTEFDWGNLLVNLQREWEVFTRAPAWPLALGGLLAGGLLAVCLLWCAVRGRGLRVCQTGVRLDLSVLITGSAIVGLANFAVAVLFTWVRLNLYGPRYLALTHLCGVFCGLLTVVLIVNLSARGHAARRVVHPALAALCALILVFKFPPVRPNPDYLKLKAVAVELAQRAPQAFVLGGYWDTYALAALAPPGTLTPVPAQDQLVRTPWTPERMRASASVLVVHHIFPYVFEVETPPPYPTFGDGQTPPARITQYGATLSLAAPHWYEQHGYVFSLYRNEAGAH